MWVAPATLAALAALVARAQALLHAPRSQAKATSHEVTADVVSSKDLQQVSKHAGIYLDKQAHPEFANIVLITASNFAYSRILKNWRCQADKLGLDYVVIALDEELQNEVGPEYGILTDGAHFTGEQRFRQGHFNEMSCMKLEIVKEIAKAGLDVVFSDPDNVFRADPFAKGVSLGDKMRSGLFDYIYQQNHGRRNLPNATSLGVEVNEGNTGFYYVRGSTKQRGVQALFAAALTECDRHQNIDDQTNFWHAVHYIRRGSGRLMYGSSNFACANLCQKGSTCAAPEEDVFSYCEMDPFEHATGWEMNATQRQQAVTYHANFVGGGIDAKIGKLDRMSFWDQVCAGAPTP